MKIEIDVEIPEGFEAAGEFREPQTGEHFVLEPKSRVIMRRTTKKIIRFVEDGKGVFVETIDGRIIHTHRACDWPIRYRREETYE